MQKVLFLASWYPVRFDPMIGLFVKRHAEIIASTKEVTVLHVSSDITNKRWIETEIKTINKVLTIVVYYKKIHKKILLLSLFFKVLFNFIAYYKGIRLVLKLKGRPQLIHIHVLTLRMGILAYLLSRWYRIPYFITEHSSNYLPEKGVKRNFLWTITSRIIAKKSNGISAVSNRLKESMQAKKYNNKHFYIIRNVVPDIFFKVDIERREKGKIIFSNITCFDDKVKNISGLVRTVARIREKRNDFELHLVGTGPDKFLIENLVKQLQLDDCIKFTGLLENEELVNQYILSDFTVLFSHYETMAVVIAESLACGRPVVVTRTGGIPELINSSNGVLVNPRDEEDLYRKIQFMMQNFGQYNVHDIRSSALRKFSSTSIALAFQRFYSYLPPYEEIY